MGALFRFIAWVVANISRWGKRIASQIGRIVSWINANWRRVLEWINAGISYGTILEWILRTLGLS